MQQSSFQKMALLLLLVVFFVESTSTLHDGPMTFLRDFYHSLDEPSRRNLPGWGNFMPSNFPCAHASLLNGTTTSWTGITCDVDGSISAVILTSLPLIGTLPSSVGLLGSALTTLAIDGCGLHGHAPTEIGLLTGLQFLILSSNNLSGAIPTLLASLVNLSIILLSQNHFSGFLPSQLSHLTSLKILDVRNNSLSGTMPSSYGSMVWLEQLRLDTNAFVGSIPEAWSQLIALQTLTINRNALTGSISGKFGALQSLRDLELQSNSLVGTLPSEFGNLRHLKSLSVLENFMEGSLPATLANIPLTYLCVASNKFGGTVGLGLPSTLLVLRIEHNLFTRLEFGHFENALQIIATGNLLTQQLDLTGLSLQLSVLALDHNRLSGTLWETQIARFSGLNILRLDDNKLQGNLQEIASLTELRHLDLSQNALSGSIPKALLNFEHLRVLNLSCNSISGTLPFFPPGLETLSLSRNLIGGKLSLRNLTALSILQVDHNSLTGVFDLPVLNALSVIDVSFNLLGGPLSSAWFENSPDLRVFIASHNCFEGPLTLALCEARSLTTLVLNALTLSCKSVTLSGGVPDCLLSQQSLSIVHLSGNGLSGPLLLGNFSSNLRDFAISYNRLEGSIPTRLLERLSQFANFDVSHNRFRGVLESASTSTEQGAQILMTVNRLSGTVPDALNREFPGVSLSILEGNMFDCNYGSKVLRERSLPTSDPYYKNAQCGSQSFDLPFYIFFGFSIVAFSTLFGLRQMHGLRVIPPCPKWAQEGVWTACETLSRLRQFSIMCSVCLITLLIPVYASTTVYFGTQTHTYIYALSAAFKSGVVPVVSLLVAWIFTLLVFNYLLWSLVGRRRSSCEDLSSLPSISNFKQGDCAEKAKRMMQAVAVIVLNVATQLVSNYLLVVYSVQGATANQAAQIIFSLFKYIYDSLGLPILLRLASKRDVSQLRCYLNIANTFLVPCFVTAFSVSTCFQELSSFYTKPVVTTQYRGSATSYYADVSLHERFDNLTGLFTGYYELPNVTVVAQEDQLIIESQFIPPFTYGYQCTSTLLQIYAPVLLVSTVFSIFQFVTEHIAIILLSWLCPVERTESEREEFCLNRILRKVPDPLLIPYRLRMRNYSHSQDASRREEESPDILDSRNFFSSCLLDILGLASFGIVCPLLSLMFSLSIFIRASRKQRLIVSYLKSQRAIADNVKGSVEWKEEMATFEASSSRFSGDDILNLHLTILLFSSSFLSLFLVDMAGDAEGMHAALVPLLMVTLPVSASVLTTHVFPTHFIWLVKAFQDIASPPRVPYLPSRREFPTISPLQHS